MANRKEPERLMNENWLTPEAPFRILQHEISRPIETHWHEFYEFAFVVAGAGTHVMNGVPAPLAPGMAVLMTPADFHEITPHPHETIYLYDLIFSGPFLREELYELLFENTTELIFTFGGEAAAAMERECARIRDEADARQPGGELIVRGSLERLLIDLHRACRAARPLSGWSAAAPIDPAIRKALRFVQHHFREPLSLKDAAGQSALSVNYFSERFHRQTGSPFQAHVQQLRLDFAANLLRSTQLPVTEICYASGFNTVAHFERAFKRRFACSPRQFRNQQQG